MAFLGGGWRPGQWQGGHVDSGAAVVALTVQVVLAAQSLVEKAKILKIIKRRQVKYLGLKQELLVK